MLILSACTDEQERTLAEAGARLNEERLVAFADEHLADPALAAAVPEDFEFTGVKRHGFDRHRNRWITVGVRMDGPVGFARGIFYVHPDEAHAHEMFERQSQLDHEIPGDRPDKHAEPWSEDGLDVENRCHVRAESLFWCHAYKGPVYLVVQSSAGWPNGRDVTPKERQAAKALLSAFGTYLEEQIPKE